MTAPRLVVVAAVARNGVIGRDGEMPWRLSTDLKRFKRLTMGKPVIMGRKTFQSIGKPLPGRFNIVVTRSDGGLPAGVTATASLEAAIATAAGEAARSGADEIAVVGGGEMYSESIGRADRLYITHVESSPAGDTHFPPIDPAVWRAVSSEPVPAGPGDSEATIFVIYDRAAPAG